jgi:hypothetical protein
MVEVIFCVRLASGGLFCQNALAAIGLAPRS